MKKYFEIFKHFVWQDYKPNTCSCYNDRCRNTIYDCRISAREVTITAGKCHTEVTDSKNYPPLCIKPLKPELNPICYLLALLGAHHFLHVSRIRVKLLTFRLLMSYIYIWSTHS